MMSRMNLDVIGVFNVTNECVIVGFSKITFLTSHYRKSV